jgi:putative colanic acid biosynthesis acetyltransferase WcaF
MTDVNIGSHVCISQGAMLCTGNHNYSSPGFELIARPIIIEDGVWIGAKALVGPGITAFSHSVLTAGSIATKNLDSYGIYQGNPAMLAKTRTIKP